jgi:hypothetical protein
MENLNNIDNNIKFAELGLIKAVLKLEIEFKNEKLSPEVRKGIYNDIENLKSIIESINTLHVFELHRKGQLKFS